MSKENSVRALVNEIQLKTNLTIEQIAERCGYVGNYLSQAMGMETPSPKIISKLKYGFADELAGNTIAKEPNTPISNKDSQYLTRQALANLSESNRLLAESNRILANSHAELVLMVKDKNGATAGVDQQTLAETVGTVLGLRELLIEVAAVVKKKTLADVQNELNKTVKAAVSDVLHKDSIAAGGN